MTSRAFYVAVFATFARNSLVRDMMFRGNFLIECVAAAAWSAINFCFYVVLYQYTSEISAGSGWTKYPFYVFLATSMIVNSVLQVFVLPNMDRFSELIRKGDLDFILLKPVDTQFAISFERIKWSGLSTTLIGVALLVYGLINLQYVPGLFQAVLFAFYIVCGVSILYSVIICLASASVWMGRNQTLYDFWFYITIFSRYPLEIFTGGLGGPLRVGFSFVIPILLVVNVPARFMAKPLKEGEWPLAAYAVVATLASLLISRWVFKRALAGYRSASS